MENAKPFLKWAGGKKQLLNEIQKYYPFENNKITKYVEPFVGGGAVLFDVLNRYKPESVYISDLNADLINTYQVVRNDAENLIALLTCIEHEYISCSNENVQKDFYYLIRGRFRCLTETIRDEENTERAAYMIFLNKSCFNGLYRVNSKGIYNSPFGYHKKPVTDKDNLRIVSDKLQNVLIKCTDYKKSLDFIDDKTFVYLDPPYRPLTNTANFTAYTKSGFNDQSQIELSEFVHQAHNKGSKFLLSNSDTKDGFFESLYSEYKIHHIQANRAINRDGNKRGAVSELLITNI